MTPPRLVASMSWMFPGIAARDSYPAAAQFGFDAIEHSFPYDVPARDVAGLLKENGLEMALMYSPCRYNEGEKGFACVPGRSSEFAASMATAVEYAEAVGCRLLGVLCGEIPADADPRVYIDVLTANLRVAADIARTAGIGIVVEPICSRRIPRFALHTLAEASAVLEQVARDNISLCYDTFHVAMEQGSIVEQFDRYKAQIGYLQIANSPSRNGPNEGELDLLFFVDHILKAGWKSWISCEYTPQFSKSPTWASALIADGRLSGITERA
jgi:2-dehydrotetronate isomerase